MTPGILAGGGSLRPFYTSLRVTKLPDASRDEGPNSQRARVSSLATRSVILDASVSNFAALESPLPTHCRTMLYSPNALFTARLPSCDFSPQGTLGSAVPRYCSSQRSSQSLILSSSAHGGVRGGMIPTLLTRSFQFSDLVDLVHGCIL